MWSFYSFLLLLAWTVETQQQGLSNILNNKMIGRQGAASFQTQFPQAPPPVPQAPSLPADGVYMWGDWGMFGACSVTCGRGIMRRQRTCYVYQQSRRQTSNGGRSSSLQALLPLILMSSAGEGMTSSADLSNILNMLGTRQGDSGPSQTESAQFQTQRQIGCPGNQIGSAPCSGRMCPFPPTAGPITSMPPRPAVTLPPTTVLPSVCLTQWGPWAQCSSSCGRGVRLRMRECNCRDPISGIDSCSEMLTTSQLCVDLPPCLPLPTSTSKAETSPPTSAATLPPVTTASGTWSSWGFWATCPSECGKESTSTRRRRCSGSGICYGKFREIRQCPSVPCRPSPPVWGEWRSYGDCSTTCGIGEKSRSRDCSIPRACSGIDIETVPCVLRPCPTPAPEWSQWETYTLCSASCGKGMRSRSRICPVEGRCPGNPVEILECENRPCPTFVPPPPKWSQWEAYTVCSTTCGKGLISRSRTCPVQGRCPGSPVEVSECNNGPCATLPPPPPEWSQWEAYTVCSTTCGKGLRSRSRTCPVQGRCPGSPVEVSECNNGPCPTLPPPPPEWSQWEAYTVCSTTCGKGLRSRSRTCPFQRRCPGSPVEVSECNNGPCPTLPPPPPQWSQWEPYGDCSVSCGQGTKFRRRTCPVKGTCPGNAVEALECVMRPCPTRPPPPTWSTWGAFTDCSKTCGFGARTRKRTCPIPDSCLGFAEEAIPCALNACPERKVPTWGTWGTYSACSKTCGVGEMTRSRSCAIPGCSGESRETMPCLEELCPPPITWGQWTTYDACSKTCGVGEKSRRRTCPVVDQCPGAANERMPCALQPCPTLAPVWLEWGRYGACSTTCGVGLKYRRRICPIIGQCMGNSSESALCNIDAPCPTPPPGSTWSQWSSFSDCSRTCGLGEKTRSRTCSVSGACEGLDSAAIPCLVRRCAIIPAWTQWGAFSECSSTCGVGQSTRIRECAEDGKCQGAANETIQCRSEPCPTLPPSVRTWNSWSPFTPCNTTCGEGSRTRYRTCPVAGGCIGSSVEFTSCDNSDCILQPVAAQWGSWGRFSSCSVTCGVGREVRFRSCPSQNACLGEGLQQRICTNVPCLACNFTAISERQDCGFPGISRTACRERGCCYDDAQDGLIWCFYGKGDTNEGIIGETLPETNLDDQPERA